MQNLIRFVLIVALLAVGMGTPAPARAAVTVGGPIVSDTTWTTANSPYIVTDNINVFEGVTLTIQPGVTVKVDAGHKILVNGQLIVNGTDASPVVFTSNQAAPAPGDWETIEFSSTAITSTVGENGEYLGGSLLKGCVVEYAGSYYLAAVIMQGILMDSCTVRLNNGVGVRATHRLQSPSWIVNSVITDNHLGVYLDHGTIMGSTISRNQGAPWLDGLDARFSRVLNNTIVDNDDARYGITVSVLGGIVDGNTIQGNTGSGAVFKVWGNSDTQVATVTNNRILHNQGGGVTVGSHVIFQNNIVAYNTASGYNAGGVVLSAGNIGNTAILSNTIIGNQTSSMSSWGSGVSSLGPGVKFEYNLVVGNSGVVSSTTGGLGVASFSFAKAEVHHNTFYGNYPYDVSVDLSDVVSGTLNYWGASTATDILAQVHDFYDDGGLGEFKFIPFMSSPDPAAPVAPPLNLSFEQNPNGSVTVRWDANPSFTTGWGYKVYYNDTGEPPFDGTGQPGGKSPIDVGNKTSITLSAPLPRFVAVTSYNNQGRESWYSQALMVRKADQAITFDPLPEKAFGDPPFVITATATSSLPVTFSADGVCSVDEQTVTLTAAGTCTLTAHQPGNDQYNPAPEVARSFNVTGLKHVFLPLLRR